MKNYKIMKKKAVIFDLDGTLVDSIQDIAIAMNQVLEKLGYKKHKEDDYQNFVGDGALMLVQNAMPLNTDENKIEEALELFKKIYGDGIHLHSKPYEGIKKMLDTLSKTELILTVLSNKPHKFTLEFIEYFFKDYPFIEVHGQKKEVPKKPHPMGAINIAIALNLEANEIIFVGDTPTDINTAKSAGMCSIGVSWGYRSVDELILAKADYIANDPEHLTQLLLANTN
jgi:phosphoglycolate phosphatase